MRLVTKSSLLFGSLLLALSVPAFAQVQVQAETVTGFHGTVDGSASLVANKNPGRSATNAVTTVYDNTASAANFAASSTDLAADWGDDHLLTGTGLLSTHMFTLYNSGSSAGALLTALVRVDLYDTGSATFLGAYQANVNFGAGLPQGYYAIVTVTGLDGLAINIPNPDIIVYQTVISKTGGASRLGIASLDPPTVGNSFGDMYINAATIGPAGWYTFGPGGIPPANPGYQVGIAQPPVGVASRSWGQLKKLYR